MNNRISTFYTTLANIILLPISFLVSIVIARVLGPEDRGVLAFIMAMTPLVSLVFTIGMGSGIFYQITSGEYKVSESFFSILMISITIGIFTVGVFWVSYWMKWFPVLNSLSINQLVLISANAILGVLSMMMMKVLQSIGDFKRYSFIKVIMAMFQPLILICLVAGYGLRINGALITTFVISFTSIVILIGRILKKFSNIKWFINLPFIMDVLRYGKSTWLGEISQQFNTRADQIIIAMFLSPAQLGIYVVAVTISELVWLVPDSVNLIMQRKLTEGKMSHHAKIEFTAKISRILITFSLGLGAIIYLVFIYILMPLGYGEAYTSSRQILLLLIPGSVGMIVCKVVSRYFLSENKGHIVTKILISGFIMNIILLFLLIPIYKIWGAAFASSLTYIFTSFVTLYLVRDQIQGSFGQFIVSNSSDLKWVLSQIKNFKKELISSV